MRRFFMDGDKLYIVTRIVNSGTSAFGAVHDDSPSITPQLPKPTTLIPLLECQDDEYYLVSRHDLESIVETLGILIGVPDPKIREIQFQHSRLLDMVDVAREIAGYEPREELRNTPDEDEPPF